MSRGGINIVRNSLLRGELWLNYRCLWVWQLIMIARGWLWMVAVK